KWRPTGSRTFGGIDVVGAEQALRDPTLPSNELIHRAARRPSQNRSAGYEPVRRGDKSCDHVRGRHFLGLRSCGPIAVSTSIISRFGLRWSSSSGARNAVGSVIPS